MAQTPYGIEKLGRLRSVLLHRPEVSLPLVTEDNRGYFLFDKVPDVDRFLEEHRAYEALLEALGVKIYHLSDLVSRNTDLLCRLPNLAYLHDTAVVSARGAFVSKMSSEARRHEELVVREALTALGVPVLWEPDEGDGFEGFLMLSPETVFVADTERHETRAVKKFIDFALNFFPEVICAEIPQERRFMHPDMVLGRITAELMVFYPPALLHTYRITREKSTEIDLKALFRARGVSLIPLSDGEQRRWGSSFVPLGPGELVCYDISYRQATVNLLEREGVKFHFFHPDALLAGGGSLRCLTLRLWRE